MTYIHHYSQQGSLCQSSEGLKQEKADQAVNCRWSGLWRARKAVVKGQAPVVRRPPSKGEDDGGQQRWRRGCTWLAQAICQHWIRVTRWGWQLHAAWCQWRAQVQAVWRLALIFSHDFPLSCFIYLRWIGFHELVGPFKIKVKSIWSWNIYLV